MAGVDTSRSAMMVRPSNQIMAVVLSASAPDAGYYLTAGGWSFSTLVNRVRYIVKSARAGR